MVEKKATKSKSGTSKSSDTSKSQKTDTISKEKNDNKKAVKRERLGMVFGVGLVIACLFSALAFTSFLFHSEADQSAVQDGLFNLLTNRELKVENITGKMGAWLADLFINQWFGLASYIFIYVAALYSYWLLRRKPNHIAWKTIRSIMEIIWLSIALGFIFESFYGTSSIYPGGTYGYYIADWLNSIAGHIGTVFILILTLSAYLIFAVDGFFNWMKNIHFPRKKDKTEVKNEDKKTVIARKTEDKDFEDSDDNGIYVDNDEPKKAPKKRISVADFFNESDAPEDVSGDKDFKEEEVTPQNQKIAQQESEDDNEEQLNEEEPLKNSDDNKETDESGDIEFEAMLGGNEDPATPVDNNTYDVKDEHDNVEMTVHMIEDDELSHNEIQNIQLEDYDPTLDLSHYEMPPIDLLQDYENNVGDVTEEELKENKNKIVETLKNFKIDIVKIKATIGPTVTLYEIVPAQGVRISKIKNLEDDIALSLAALGIRIIAPIPGKGTIGIEVPNRTPQMVTMRSIIASRKYQESTAELPIAMGRTISNEIFISDLAKMPHMLMAGATGQGKSVGINAMIVSLLYKKHPAQVKFVFVDPKKVELNLYSIIERHFLAKLPDSEEPIITDVEKVKATLNSVSIEMDSRYDLLKIAGARNIKEYNKKFIERKLNPEKGHRYIPYIVVVIDEFADLIMTAGKEVELPIARIAQLARAVGIHMVIATQRPSANIITGIIKANFPTRVAFKVASMIDSRTILDASGANQLIGKGDMLFSQGSEMVRLQCAFVDTPEVESICEYISKQQAYPTAYLLPEYVGENGESGDAVDMGNLDELIGEAARMVVINQQGSTSMIQRKFSIGYNRAGRIMDQLESIGIVGPADGSKPRKVLIQDEYSLEQLLNR